MLTSVKNPRIQHIRKLQRSARARRDVAARSGHAEVQEGGCWLEGGEAEAKGLRRISGLPDAARGAGRLFRCTSPAVVLNYRRG